VALVFTLAFAYFGRPPLVMQGMFNTHQLIEPDVTWYRLGSPAWGSGKVTYPIAFSTPTKSCTGTVTLKWTPYQWWLSDAVYEC